MTQAERVAAVVSAAAALNAAFAEAVAGGIAFATNVPLADPGVPGSGPAVPTVVITGATSTVSFPV